MKKTLCILIFITSLVYALKVLNSDLMMQGKSKWYLARHTVTGALGSSQFVWWTYELLAYYKLPEGLCLATAGAVGYLGADVVARLFEKFIEKFIGKF